jgi:hypothetical protein
MQERNEDLETAQLDSAEWDFSKVSDRDRSVCCFHELLREANIAGKHDKPWLRLSKATRKTLRTHYSRLVKLRLHYTFTPETVVFSPRIPLAAPVMEIHKRLREVEWWWNLTDKELKSAFADWLKLARPANSSPTSRGKNKENDLVVRLERIGAMRLLHRYRRKELLAFPMPQEMRIRFQSGDDQDRKRAAKLFAELFPSFARMGIKPRSWPTAMQRRK